MPEAAAVGMLLSDPGGVETTVAAFGEVLPALVPARCGTAGDDSILLVPESDVLWPRTVDDAALAYVARSLGGLVRQVVVLDHGVDIADAGNRARMYELLAWFGSQDGPCVVRSSESWSRYVIDRLRRSVVDDPDLFEGRVAVLDRLDSNSRSEYVATLTAVLDHGGDVGAAAETMFLHPNTLRYRLRRMREIAGLDLADPQDRFVAELQVRLRFSRQS